MRSPTTLLNLARRIWAGPRREIQIANSIRFDPRTAVAIAAVDDSAGFAAGLEHLPSDLPGFDDMAFVHGGSIAVVTAADGKIWTVDPATRAAHPLAKTPLMAYGIHEAPDDPNHVYLCASHSYGKQHADGAVGLYRLRLDDGSVELLVGSVPATGLSRERPVVYGDDDPSAPELRRGDDQTPRRPLAVCDNLDVSEDGRRIYFSEPFDYFDASVDDAVDEAIALAPNGRLWRHDLDSGATRLIAEGFHFINGVLCDLHPGQPRERSVLVTQTSLFRLTRFHVAGPKAGTAEVVLDGITGMPDGMDRDSAGRIWLALFADRGPVLTWLHANAWLKPLIMRLPAKLLLRGARRTGVAVVSPDGSTPLYAAMYRGPLLTSIPSAVPAADGIYLANLSLDATTRGHRGIMRLRWPDQLRPAIPPVIPANRRSTP